MNIHYSSVSQAVAIQHLINPYKLTDGSTLLLASSYVTDRNKRIYRGSLKPDFLIKDVTDHDDALKAAQKWLKEN